VNPLGSQKYKRIFKKKLSYLIMAKSYFGLFHFGYITNWKNKEKKNILKTFIIIFNKNLM
jgi:hypothetical protein